MRYLPIILFPVLLLACSSDEGGVTEQPDENFKRSEMLTDWASDYINPELTAFSEDANSFNSEIIDFFGEPNQQNLDIVRESWEKAYLQYQRVAMMNMGPSEEINFSMFANTYPTDSEKIDAILSGESYNLDLFTSTDLQGFPALDYLLFGKFSSDEEIISAASSNGHFQSFVLELTEKLANMGSYLNLEWASYSDEFINNDGSSANASVDRFVNDYIEYYERRLRAGKIGIPAGVFGNTPDASQAEAYYNSEISKQLLLAATKAFSEFFSGKSGSFTSLQQYLNAVEATKNDQPLSTLINQQINAAEGAAQNLNADIATQVEENNVELLEVYDEYQKVVPLLKVDMMQALVINIDYVDADGD